MYDSVTPKIGNCEKQSKREGRATYTRVRACAAALREFMPGEADASRGPRLRELPIQSGAITETMQSMHRRAGIGAREPKLMCVSLHDLAHAYLHRASNPRGGTRTGARYRGERARSSSGTCSLQLASACRSAQVVREIT